MSSTIPSAKPRWTWILCLAGLFGGLLVGFHPMILSGFKRMPADPGDTILNHYFLEHSWHWVSDSKYPATFWSPRFFHPVPKTLTFSENLIGVAPLYWGLRLTCNEENAWQWWILIISATNYLAMYVVLRWFGINPFLAVLGAFLFAFGLPRQDQFCHQQLLPQAFGPFIIWHFWKMLQEPTRRRWVYLLLLTAWQLLASIHLGWFLFLTLGIWLLILLPFDRRILARLVDFWKMNHWLIFVTFIIWVVGLGLFFRNYYLGNASERREYFECLYFMPKLTAWLAFPAHSLLDLRLVPDDYEHLPEQHLGIGIAFYLSALVAFLWSILQLRRDYFQQKAAILSLSSILCCLVLVLVTFKTGDDRSLWYFVFETVPGANSIRAIGRGLIGTLHAIEVIFTANIPSTRLRAWLSFALMFVGIAEHVRFEIESFERAEAYPRIERLSREINGADAVFVYRESGGPSVNAYQEIAAMWAGFKAGVPVINGYSGREPTNYLRDLSEWNLKSILVFLGPAWQGKLLVILPGATIRKEYYEVLSGDDPAKRAIQVRTETVMR
ncbi:MAG: hypothetical protein K8T89_21545 [Planctomycetes bacterium]|nr:hypothetical protein [Planctomycetota bacterium]